MLFEMFRELQKGREEDNMFKRDDDSIIDPFNPAFRDEWFGWKIAAAIGAALAVGLFVAMVVIPSLE